MEVEQSMAVPEDRLKKVRHYLAVSTQRLARH